ncbi:MAG: type II toxin-antitoxin system RelE/ParE family toxin [Dehalococcoidia bacterium]|nr:type II toxin-antitoxin system RelE/ParE family toxin [Dehalococcoidia bacterium]
MNKKMYQVIFYKDKNGEKPMKKYIRALEKSPDDDKRALAAKINRHIDYLAEMGLSDRRPKMAKVRGEIWELRPQPDRILFAAWYDNKFILLHHFRKDTDLIPESEKKQAERNLKDFKDRFGGVHR